MAHQHTSAWESEGSGREGDASDRGSRGDTAVLGGVLREDITEPALERIWGKRATGSREERTAVRALRLVLVPPSLEEQHGMDLCHQRHL